MLKKMNKKFKNFIFINIGVMGLAFAFSFFLSPYNLVVGGIGGIAINFVNILTNFNIEINSEYYSLIESGIMMGINVILLILAFIGAFVPTVILAFMAMIVACFEAHAY